MISLLPSREELASAGWGLEAFVGRRPAARPRIGRLPPFLQEGRPRPFHLGRGRPSLSLGWSVVPALPSLSSARRGKGTSRFPAAVRQGASQAPGASGGGAPGSSATFQKTSPKLVPQLGPPKPTGTTNAFI